MMSEKELSTIAIRELIQIFGKAYLRENYSRICEAVGMVADNIFQFFIGIKGFDDLPDRQANDHGWVVYGLIYLDATTGEILKKEYAKE